MKKMHGRIRKWRKSPTGKAYEGREWKDEKMKKVPVGMRR
jgi:hypothetical protein